MNIAKPIVSVLSVVIATCPTWAGGPPSLVLWNKLGSQMEIENSEVGLNGTITGGGFGPGMFGGAYVAQFDEDLLASFPKEVIPIDAGTIEFWGKLIGFPPQILWGALPHFVQIQDGSSAFVVGLNANNGLGGGGLVGVAGQSSAQTGGFTFGMPYEQILGVGEAEDWHHYALVWDKNGIAGVIDGTKKVAVFLDGQLDSGRFFPEGPFVPLTGDALGLITISGGALGGGTQGSAAIDNIIIWDFAKTDFSDRFSEVPGLVLWNKLGSQMEIENSEVGLNGTITGAGFGPGMFGGAYRADFTQDLQASFPKEVIPIDAGTIEFWGRIEGFTTNMYWGPNPRFIELLDGVTQAWHVELNGNNGGGLGGITAGAGEFGAGTGPFFSPNTVSYEQFLGVGQAEAWHHYALVWDRNGVPGVDGGTRKLAVFLDGQLDSMAFIELPGADFLPIISGQLDLILIGDGQAPDQGVALIDNIKIWDFAKIDFSDRFVEGFFEADGDSDGIPDASDNCPLTPNPSQTDNDDDGTGNACDECLNDFGPPDNGGCPRPEVPPGTEVENLPSGCDIVVDGRFGSTVCGEEWADITPVVTLGGDCIIYQALDPDGGDLYLMYDFVGSSTPLGVGEESGVVRFFVNGDVFDVFFIQGGSSGTGGDGDGVRVEKNGLPFDDSLGSIVGAVDFNQPPSNSSPNFNQPHNLFELEVKLLETPQTPGGSTPGDGGLYSPDPAFWGAALPGSPLVQVSANVIDIGAGGNVVAVVSNMIDIKPGSDPNSININSMGVVPVAILGSETFDVADVDVTTLAFGPDGASPAHDLTDPIVYADHLQDVNSDGFTDLVSHYRQKETGLMQGDLQACIVGQTIGGEPVFGCDSVNIVGATPKGGSPRARRAAPETRTPRR